MALLRSQRRLYRSWSGAGSGSGRDGRRIDRQSDRFDEVDEAWPPARHDVVVEFDDGAVLDGRELVPAGALGNGLGTLAAADGVGQEDDVRISVDEVLVAELRIPEGGFLFLFLFLTDRRR